MNRTERIAELKKKIVNRSDLAHGSAAIADQLARYAAICERAGYVDLQRSVLKVAREWSAIAVSDRSELDYLTREFAYLANPKD